MSIRMPIRLKITILSFGIVLFSLLIGGVILIGNFMHQKEAELGQHAMITARTVAQLHEVRQNIMLPAGWDTLNPVIEKIRVINQVTYIDVINMNRIRYSDPVNSLLGTRSSSADESPAFADHTYLSKAKGELGVAVRAFVPIMNQNHQQIGIVVVGKVLPTFTSILLQLRKEIVIILVLTLLFGIMGSGLLARHIKRETFQLEPHEIAHMLVERTATFNAMNEGIVAIDKQQKITVFNQKAYEMLHIPASVIGQPISEVIPETELEKTLLLKEPEYNKEIRIGSFLLLSNRIPITIDGRTVGAVAVFQDRTEVTKMAEELTGVKAFVEALRVQNHEHMNKLHTIAGLIQLENHKQALDYVFDSFNEHEKLSHTLRDNICADSISGLLISKVSKGRELGVTITIDPRSRLQAFPDLLDQHDFVHVLGNLIENSLHALEPVDHDKKIDISIEQNQETCSILVEDNGIGMNPETIEHIFEHGFTTKGNRGSGIGLHLVNKIVNKAHGHLDIASKPGSGTAIILSFPMNAQEAI